MYVKIIADSKNAFGDRITTIEAEYPLYIHAQVMTHRMFSRNAQSSRAVPTLRLLELIEKDNFTPLFAENKAGMEAGEELSDTAMKEASELWKVARCSAITTAKVLHKIGVHKQWVNRLLMPFMNIKVIITATEWGNFFNLRLEHDAQPEIQELARLILKGMNETHPQLLKSGEWHLPYVTDEDRTKTSDDNILRIISAARCSRVSYLNHNKSNPDFDADITQSDNLWTSGHYSPFEHQATPVKQYRDTNSQWEKGITHMDKQCVLWSGNFKGFVQSRCIGFDDELR